MTPQRRYSLRGREVQLEVRSSTANDPSYALIGRLFTYLDELLPPEDLTRAEISVRRGCVSLSEKHGGGFTKRLNIYPTQKKVEVVIPPEEYAYSEGRTKLKGILEKAFPGFQIEKL